ncbi:NlpC/P60 family protein [Anabaena catenula]|uniref:C40 family peptidase n=1 Tax=Anabaena catenula FACHB-362 TaxID=2692877 RepID=A0ABR8J9X0_9NOST|nr:NlpC/P60 family protein [Anabaena catenula]MBD2694438.1 C40 family peptidase [Anabaena catenula FACHB-362]
MTKLEIVTTAREWLGTPYHHQARAKGVGVDCIGLVLGVLKELGVYTFDFTDYDRTPDSTVLQSLLEEHCTQTDNPEPGDIHLFRIKRNPQHVGLCSDIGLIHAYQGVGKVVEHTLDEFWQRRIIKSFILPGI